jgi:predicted O-linked N-acetylglucosamine transferase (SPINDLY family)
MTICSVLTPFILLSDCKKASETVSSYFSIPAEDFSLYALVPLDQASNVSEIAIRLHRSTYSIQNVEALLIENQQLISHLNRSKETILTMKTQVLRKNNLYYDEKYMRRMEKLKKLNEDNRKLRELLK